MSINSTDVLQYIGVGEKNAIHAQELASLTKSGVREISFCIEELRRGGEVILSSSSGYFKPETMLEVDAHIHRERSRASNILKTLKTVEEYKRKVEEK